MHLILLCKGVELLHAHVYGKVASSLTMISRSTQLAYACGVCATFPIQRSVAGPSGVSFGILTLSFTKQLSDGVHSLGAFCLGLAFCHPVAASISLDICTRARGSRKVGVGLLARPTNSTVTSDRWFYFNITSQGKPRADRVRLNTKTSDLSTESTDEKKFLRRIPGFSHSFCWTT